MDKKTAETALLYYKQCEDLRHIWTALLSMPESVMLQLDCDGLRPPQNRVALSLPKEQGDLAVLIENAFLARAIWLRERGFEVANLEGTI